MDTDTHGLKTQLLSVYIRVNPWPNCVFQHPASAGKTFIAVNLMKKIGDAGQLKRALFVCDRDELRAQGLGAFQNVFGADAAEVCRKPDGTNNARNAPIHVATYQTLDIDTGGATNLSSPKPAS